MSPPRTSASEVAQGDRQPPSSASLNRSDSLTSMHVLCQRAEPRKYWGLAAARRRCSALVMCSARVARTNNDQRSADQGFAAGTLCRRVAITRSATASELTSKIAESRNGAPGRCQSRCAADERRERLREQDRADQRRNAEHAAVRTLQLTLLRRTHETRHHALQRRAHQSPQRHEDHARRRRSRRSAPSPES